MTIFRNLALANLILAAGIAAPAHAQGLLGQSVDVTYQVAANLTDFGTQTITSSGNTFADFGNAIMVTVTPTQFTYSLAPSHLAVGNNPTSFFVGYIASETGSHPTPITSVTIDPTTTAVGFTDSSITFNATDVFANFSGTEVTQGQSLVLDYSTSVDTSPVPEASTTVSFGLLLVLGLGGVVIAARKKKAATAT